MNRYNLWGWAWLVVAFICTNYMGNPQFGVIANVVAMYFFLRSIMKTIKDKK